jgi:hypothetical protein
MRCSVSSHSVQTAVDITLNALTNQNPAPVELKPLATSTLLERFESTSFPSSFPPSLNWSFSFFLSFFLSVFLLFVSIFLFSLSFVSVFLSFFPLF